MPDATVAKDGSGRVWTAASTAGSVRAFIGSLLSCTMLRADAKENRIILMEAFSFSDGAPFDHQRESPRPRCPFDDRRRRRHRQYQPRGRTGASLAVGREHADQD